MAELLRTEKTVYEGFFISVLLKGIISFNEIVSGLITLLVPPQYLYGLAVQLVHTLYASDPNGFLATHLLALAQQYTGAAVFVGWYLLARGVIKLVLIIAMLMKLLWAYPASLVVLGLLVLYQLYEIITTHSIPVVLITIFDLVVMYFIWREYKILKAHIAMGAQTKTI